MKKRMLSIFMVLALLLTALPVGVLADQGTTTLDTVYKDMSPNTGIYAVSGQPSAAYPYYGAKWEPNGKVYVGRVAHAQPLENGAYGLINKAELDGESAFSFYYSLEDDYSLAYWKWIYGSLLDGNHAFLLNLNFDQLSTSCRNVLQGKFDARLRETFTYLSSLTCPIFLRIGGEMNVWDDGLEPTVFISAYQYIAQMARQLSPNVALVFSPNFSSRYGVDMDSFYPGDSYVDWVGASLYYNRYAINGDTENDAFYGVNAYGDPMLNVQQTVNLSRLHKKPVIITEGGSIHWEKGEDLTSFAAERVQKAYSFLTMVYPEIKCIIYSDTDFNDKDRQYSLYKNKTVAAAYNSAVSANPTLVGSLQDSGAYYTPLSQYTISRGGALELAAYTYTNGHPTARWFLDGALQKTTSEYPYACTMDTSALADGEHTIQVVFSNGASKCYTFSLGAGGAAQPAAWEPFGDITGPECYAYYGSILWAVGKGITNGTAAGVFSPAASCTRGQAVTFLWRAMGSPAPQSANNPFTDVAPGAYYYDAVLWAVEKGITTGMTETTFEPDGTVVRGQMVTFLHRMHDVPAASGGSFSDVPAGIYYENAVRWAVEKGITNGTGDGKFSPDDNCTRAQIVTFLYRDQVQ